MRIVNVIPYFYPAWDYGGQPRSAFELARGMVKRGHGVKVLTTDSLGMRRIEFDANASKLTRNVEGIDVHYYRNISNRLAFHHRLFWPSRLFRELDSQLRETDVLHIHELRSPLTVAAARSAARLGIPFVLSPHGGLQHLGKRAMKVGYDFLFGRSILHECSILFAVSPSEIKDAISMGVSSTRIRQVPNAIAISGQRPPQGLFRKKWGLGSGRIVLFLGRLQWIKGADLLIEAFSRLPFADCRLAIAGPDDGELTKLRAMAAEKALSDRIVFTGFLNDEEKLAAFADSDVLVVPSRHEVFALAAVEALAAGLPILMSNACGLSPMPGPEHGAQLFSSGDAADLAAKLAAVLQDPTMTDSAQEGRMFVAGAFSVDSVTLKAEAAYEDAIRQNLPSSRV